MFYYSIKINLFKDIVYQPNLSQKKKDMYKQFIHEA